MERNVEPARRWQESPARAQLRSAQRGQAHLAGQRAANEIRLPLPSSLPSARIHLFESRLETCGNETKVQNTREASGPPTAGGQAGQPESVCRRGGAVRLPGGVARRAPPGRPRGRLGMRRRRLVLFADEAASHGEPGRHGSQPAPAATPRRGTRDKEPEEGPIGPLTEKAFQMQGSLRVWRLRGPRGYCHLDGLSASSGYRCPPWNRS